MGLVEFLWSHWIFVAFLAPFFWALVNIIDVYFVSSVYEDEWDGIIISSLFQLVPWLLLIFGLVSFQYPGFPVVILAFLAGGFLTIAFFFYFKTLFASNDVVVIGALWNLSIPLVPFLAWLFIAERLSFMNYLGIGLAFVGAIVLSVHEKIRAKNLKRVLVSMAGAVTFLSLSMVVQKKVYSLIGDDFWTGFLLFSAGATITGLLILFFDPKPLLTRTAHLLQMTKSFFFVFFLAETLNLFAILASQRAIALSPAVSFVAAIESAVPVFVILLSFLLFIGLTFFNKEKARQIYQNQLVALKTKILASCIIAVGIYLIS